MSVQAGFGRMERGGGLIGDAFFFVVQQKIAFISFQQKVKRRMAKLKNCRCLDYRGIKLREGGVGKAFCGER